MAHDVNVITMRYKNPTLAEIVAELHLEAGLLPEKSMMAFARELAARGFEDQEVMQSVVLVEVEGKEELDLEPRQIPRVRCWDRERTMLIQLSPDVVFVNLVGEYPGWKRFMEHVGTALTALESNLKIAPKLARVDLTVIDKWKAGPAPFTIGRYLNCGGEFIPQWYSEATASSDIILGQGFHLRDGFNKKINVSVRVSADSVRFQIVTALGVTNSKNAFSDLMDLLHREAVRCFEAIITDEVRNEIMGGKL